MILPRYRIADSLIPGAGKGLFLDQDVAASSVLIAPDRIDATHTLAEIEAMPDREAALAASVRWFEDRYTVSRDWPDECYVNHSFAPTGLWHLGFVFANQSLVAGTEITVDYRHLLGEGQVESFPDARSGEAIVGWSWHDSLAQSTAALAALLAR